MVLHKYNSEKHGYGIEKASHTRKKLQNQSDKRIKSRLYKEILNSIIIRNPVKIHAYDMKRYFSKEENGWQTGICKDTQHQQSLKKYKLKL